MRVLLLNPVTRDGTRSLRVGRCQGKVIVGIWPAVEYGTLAPLIAAAGHEVALLDANHLGLSCADMLRRALDFAPDVVFLLSITATLDDDRALADRIVASAPGARVVFWGTHATARPGDYLDRQGHLLIRREPDLTAVALLAALEDGAARFEDVSGVGWHDGDALRLAPDRAFVADLDELPMADHGLMRTGEHLATDTRRPFALIKTSRGCPQRCTFCTARTFHGSRWRPRSPEAIVEEIRHVVRSTGVRDVFLQSDVFSQRRAWTAALAEGIARAELGVTWFCNSRVDTVDAPLLALMKRSGCRLVAFGVESGADRVLEAVHKGATRAQAERALAACRRVGLPSLTYWVFGLPGETEETIGQTIDFIDAARPDYAHFYSPTPLPGTDLYTELGVDARVRAGQIDWSDFFQGVSSAFVTPTISAAEVERAITTAYRRFYADPRRLLRELGRLRDLDALRGRVETLWTMLRNYGK